MYARRAAPKQEQDSADGAEELAWTRRSVSVPSLLPPLPLSVPAGGRVPGPPGCQPQQVEPAPVLDPVSVYLLARGQVCRCLQWTTCHHHPYLWLWPPFLPPASPLRLHHPIPAQHAGGLAAWRHDFAVDSPLAPRDVWPPHLPHLSRLAPDTLNTGDYSLSLLRVACVSNTTPQTCIALIGFLKLDGRCCDLINNNCPQMIKKKNVLASPPS